jgi:hypothetical protein
MLERVLQLLNVACSHRKISQPFAAASPSRTSSADSWESVGVAVGHYVVCLECGKKFSYDWAEMRMVR